MCAWGPHFSALSYPGRPTEFRHVSIAKLNPMCERITKPQQYQNLSSSSHKQGFSWCGDGASAVLRRPFALVCRRRR